MTTTAPTFTGTTLSTGALFPGSGSNYSTLGITATQASQRVTITGQQAYTASGTATSANAAEYGATQAAPQVASVADALAQFSAAINADPSFAATMAQNLYNAGLMSTSVYNAGGSTNIADVYNAYKAAVLRASSTGIAVDQYIQQATAEFNAQGGPKVKLPSIRYAATITSTADVLSAGDAVFEKILGRRMTPTELAAIHSTLNAAELQARTQEAQSAYSQLLGYRGLNPDGTPVGGGNATPVAPPVPGQASTAQQLAQGSAAVGGTGATVGGPANLPQQVTNAQGQVSTVTSGPIVTPYNQAPSPDAAAYQYAMTNDQPEVQGRTIAAAMQAIAQFVGQK